MKITENEMNLIKRILNRIMVKLDFHYNNRRIDRRNLEARRNKRFFATDNYWQQVSEHIKSVAQNDQENFFRDPEVILHLAGESPVLGYKLLDQIRLHPLGSYALNRCSTPPWGAPFILKNYPFLSPTCASHLANILSIYNFYGQNISSILDFGGGYGGLARCLTALDPDVEIRILDLPDMLYVQNKFLRATTSSGNFGFFSDIDELRSLRIDIFNASFSFSETPLLFREKIENFIVDNSKGVHIIFQSRFNGIDNLEYMDAFKMRLESHGWLVKIENYAWYANDSVYLLCGRSKSTQEGAV